MGRDGYGPDEGMHGSGQGRGRHAGYGRDFRDRPAAVDRGRGYDVRIGYHTTAGDYGARALSTDPHDIALRNFREG